MNAPNATNSQPGLGPLIPPSSSAPQAVPVQVAPRPIPVHMRPQPSNQAQPVRIPPIPLPPPPTTTTANHQLPQVHQPRTPVPTNYASVPQVPPQPSPSTPPSGQKQPSTNLIATIPEFAAGINTYVSAILYQHNQLQSLVSKYKSTHDQLRLTLNESERRSQEYKIKLAQAADFDKKREAAYHTLVQAMEQERLEHVKEKQLAAENHANLQKCIEKLQASLFDALVAKDTSMKMLQDIEEDSKKLRNENLGMKEEIDRLNQAQQQPREERAAEVEGLRAEIQSLQEENAKLTITPAPSPRTPTPAPASLPSPSPSPPPEKEPIHLEIPQVDLSKIVPDYSQPSINWIRRERAEFREESEKLRQEREKLTQLQKLPEELDTLKSRIEFLESSLDSEHALKHELEKRLDKGKEEVQGLKMSLEGEIRRTKELKDRISFLQATEADREDALRSATTRVKSCEEELSKRAAQVVQLEALVEELKEKDSESQKREASLHAELEETRSKRVNADQNLANARDELKALRAELASEQSKTEKEINRLEALVKQTRDEVVKVQATETKARDQLEKARQDQTKVTQNLSNAETKLKTFQKGLDAAQSEALKKKDQVERLQSRLDQLSSEKDSAVKDLEETKKELEGVKTKYQICQADVIVKENRIKDLLRQAGTQATQAKLSQQPPKTAGKEDDESDSEIEILENTPSRPIKNGRTSVDTKPSIMKTQDKRETPMPGSSATSTSGPKEALPIMNPLHRPSIGQRRPLFGRPFRPNPQSAMRTTKSNTASASAVPKATPKSQKDAGTPAQGSTPFKAHNDNPTSKTVDNKPSPPTQSRGQIGPASRRLISPSTMMKKRKRPVDGAEDSCDGSLGKKPRPSRGPKNS